MARSKLACCLVVRNEANQISDCLDCITVLADEIIIVDTGSSDGTLSIVSEWVIKHNARGTVKTFSVGNQFHDSDGDFDFGAAKTYALKNATTDFVMWMDATDRVTNQESIKRKFIEITDKSKDIYIALPTALSDDFAFIRTRIGPREVTSMVGRIHEFMGFNNASELTRHFISEPIMNKKVGRDLSRNLRQLHKEWKERPSARICFYIALTNRELGNRDAAIEWFRRRIYTYGFKDEFAEEYFKSLESIAEIMIETPISDLNLIELYDISEEMISKNPLRVEGYYYRGKYHFYKKEYQKAIDSYQKYRTCKKPTTYKLWVNGSIYKGKAISTAIEECTTAMKYEKVLQPDEILDLNPTRSTFTRGDSQYY